MVTSSQSSVPSLHLEGVFTWMQKYDAGNKWGIFLCFVLFRRLEMGELDICHHAEVCVDNVIYAGRRGNLEESAFV